MQRENKYRKLKKLGEKAAYKISWALQDLQQRYDYEAEASVRLLEICSFSGVSKA